MHLPEKAIFAFNANLDHLRHATDSDVEAIERRYPPLASQMSECFAYGVQKEIGIDAQQCGFFLSQFKFDRALVGGQAGNAAQQASALGVQCYLHSNFANELLLSLFSHREMILVANEGGFVPAPSFSSEVASAHHFVFEHAENRTRFIASYDPFPLHPDGSFCSAIGKELPGVKKAFVSGLHLVKTPERARKFIAEMRRWKETNPSLRIFFEMAEFQNLAVLESVRAELFSVADMVGLNEVELGQLGCGLEELATEAKAVLFHSPERQEVLPGGKLDASALKFAEKCASFLAKNGRHGSLEEIAAFEGGFVESPARTVGLGDAFSCAYFMACK